MTHPQGEPETLPNVHQCIAKAMGQIDAVGKGGENTRDHYKFKRIDDFLDAANGAMAEAGVHVVPFVLKRKTDETHTTSNNNVMRWVDLKVRFRFYGPAGDYVDCVTWGEGRDASDKATNKAMSAAMKYALMFVLMVPTGDIQDADRDSPESGESRQRRQQGDGQPGGHPVTSEVRQLQERILAIGEERKLSRAEIIAEFAAWLPTQRLNAALTIGTADVVVLQGFVAHLQAAKPPTVPEGQEELPGAGTHPAAPEDPPVDAPAVYVPGDPPPPIPDDIEDRMARAKATAK